MNKKFISKTPFGSVCIVWSVSEDVPKIFHILLSRPGWSAEEDALRMFPGAVKSSCAKIDDIADSIRAYLYGKDVSFSLREVDLSQCTRFQQSVLRAQYAIPRGQVSTYGLVAAHAGAPGGARAVGNVMATNPFPIIIPCHRTIRSGMQLGGFGGGVNMKRAMLENEGVMFDHAGRVVCKRLYYAPS